MILLKAAVARMTKAAKAEGRPESHYDHGSVEEAGALAYEIKPNQ